mmetsp:Transcript_31246/g.47891  ORF Transcript_31246/g.47891 Transcript_31246/m.47891 type:complete len:352 (+) Transcript_31246:79-1134(+)
MVELSSVTVDSDFDPETPSSPILVRNGNETSYKSAEAVEVRGTMEPERYDAAKIRAEFRTCQSILPDPDKLLQERHSFELLRNRILEQSNNNNIDDLPRFLKFKHEGGIEPHLALCCLLLSEYGAEFTGTDERRRKRTGASLVYPWLVLALSLGFLHVQLDTPAEFIRDQFYRVAHAVPTDLVKPTVLRKNIRNRGLPVPNYFLDPEDSKQFPPHIALLVILQDGERESRKFGNILYRVAFDLFALVALLLRIVLEVIGGAGAIWGGAEVFALRTSDNKELWRWISVSVGTLCFLRFLTLNAPQREDEGDILGPAGPWSLRLPVRLRAVCDHPFHYFVRALPPFSPTKKHD